MQFLARRRFITVAFPCVAMISLALLSLVGAAANAGEFTSAYTGLDLKKDCRLVDFSDEGAGFAEWRCKGFDGISVRLVEGDLRFHVSYGRNAKNQTAARQTISRFNYVNDKLEWRLKKLGGKLVPFATILRYFAEADDFKEQYLVVTRLDGDDACQVGHVPTSGNPKANETARQLADSLALNGPCPADLVPEYGPDLRVLQR